MSKSESVKIVETAIDVLLYVSNTNNGIGPRDISRMFDMSTTAAQRLVTALERKECLKFDPVSQKYRLGYGLIRFIPGTLGKFDLTVVAKPYMEKLRDSTGETICLNVMAERKRMTIFQVESKHELRWVAEVGRLYPLYIGASGKVILAHLERAVIDKILQEQLPDSSMQEKQLLNEQLEQIKQTKFAVTFGERIPGGVGIAVPIKVQGDIASLSIYAPTTRVDDDTIADYVTQLKQAAGMIEHELGLAAQLQLKHDRFFYS